LNPKYEDGKAVLVDIKGILDVNPVSNSWSNSSHSLTYTKIFK
jgi:hypothetical protein